MQPLDYGGPGTSATTTDAALLFLPVYAGLITFLALVHNVMGEPFGVFDAFDAAVQVGGPILVFFLWLAWLLMAMRSRVRLRVLLPVTAWGIVNLWIAGAGFLLPYFSEPWNY